MKKLLIILALVTSGLLAFGQRSTVYVEGLGSAISRVSLNYDYHFSNHPSGLGVRVGVAYMKDEKTHEYRMPLMANYTIGDRHGLELSGGGLFNYKSTGKSLSPAPITAVSYKYTGRLLSFRAGLTQLLLKNDSSSPSHFGFLQYCIPGVSLGLRF